MTEKKKPVTVKPVTVKPVIEISVEAAELLVSAVMKMKLWADPGQIKYIRKHHKELLKLTAVKDG